MVDGRDRAAPPRVLRLLGTAILLTVWAVLAVEHGALTSNVGSPVPGWLYDIAAGLGICILAGCAAIVTHRRYRRPRP